MWKIKIYNYIFLDDDRVVILYSNVTNIHANDLQVNSKGQGIFLLFSRCSLLHCTKKYDGSVCSYPFHDHCILKCWPSSPYNNFNNIRVSVMHTSHAAILVSQTVKFKSFHGDLLKAMIIMCIQIQNWHLGILYIYIYIYDQIFHK